MEPKAELAEARGWPKSAAILSGTKYRPTRLLDPMKTNGRCTWLVAIVIASLLLCISINKINCDLQQSATNESPAQSSEPQQQHQPLQATGNQEKSEDNSTTQAAPVLSTSSAPTTTAQPAMQTVEEYKQRPNPLGSSPDDVSGTKINYDMQHEQTSTNQQLSSGTTAATTTTTPAIPQASSSPLRPQQAANTSSGSLNALPEEPQQPVIEKKSLIDDDALMSGYQTGGVGAIATGEVVVGDESNSQTQDYLASASGNEPQSAMGPSSSSVAATVAPLDDSSLDLDSAAATNPSIISRHGRASTSQVNAYSPPASSRLSAYSPSLLLQNSRSPLAFNTQQQQQPQTTTIAPKPSHPFDPIIVCYLGSWSVYRPSLAKFTPENINPFLCTHIIYAFAGLSSKYELKPFDSYNDITQGGYRKFTSLKEHNKQLKTLIAVGGWNEGSARFSKLVASPELRANFISSTVRFLREHRFDGLDLDWEYPSYRDGSSQDDKERYATLIKELRVAFDKDKENHPKSEKLLLSVAVPAGQDNIDNGFDVPTISKNVDFMNVLTYDYYTAFDKQTNHHAPLTIADQQSVDANSKRLNIDWTINYYLSLGAAPNKLIVGVPTYGRSYTLSQPLAAEVAPLTGHEEPSELAERVGLGARADSPGDEGPATREKGYLAYYEICQKIDNEQWHKQRYASEHQGPVAFKDHQWVSFDDVESAVMKAEYVIKNRLGGVMIWTLDNDDFRGSCPSSRQQENPLITAVRDTIIKSVAASAPGSGAPHNQQRKQPAAITSTSTSTTTTTTTTTTSTTTTTTPAPPPAFEEETNELGGQSGGDTAAASESSSSLIKSLASGARQQAPTTPDPGPAFTCKDEGFFPNPKDCKKYFWCLDSGPANLGVVAHAFTCPSGLFFNSQTEGCDYPEKVSCKQQKSAHATSTSTTTTTTTTSTTTPAPQPAAATRSVVSRDREPAADTRNRLVIKKNRKPSTTSTTTTSTTTTTTTPPPPTTTQAPLRKEESAGDSIPNTNDINELVASMLQNPQFASVINNQLKMSHNGASNKKQQHHHNHHNNNNANQQGDAAQPQDDQEGSMSGADAEAQLEQMAGTAANSKQAQELLQLLNLIQSLGGVDKIAPYLTGQAAAAAATTAPGAREPDDSDGEESQPLDVPGAYGNQESGVNRQRRPQLVPVAESTTANSDNSNGDQQPGSSFVFNYGQPTVGQADQRVLQSKSLQPDASGSGADRSGIPPQTEAPQLSTEIMNNLAQLESLFAYNQPGRPSEMPAPIGSIESQPFTVDDAKFQPLLPLQQQQQPATVPVATRQRQEPVIRVQVPEKLQRGQQHPQQHQQQQQHRQVKPSQAAVQRQQSVSQQQQQQQQLQQHQHQQQQRNQQHFMEINNYLPYLEGDVRQPVGQQQRVQQQQQTRSRTAQVAQASNSHHRAQAPDQSQQGAESVGAVPRQRRPQQQQQSPQQQPMHLQQQPQQPQQRRRPPNRERGQRVNTADFAATSTASSTTTAAGAADQRPRSLVLLAPGPPEPSGSTVLGEDESGGASLLGESISERALEERLRQLESGFYSSSTPSSVGAFTTVQSAAPAQVGVQVSARSGRANSQLLAAAVTAADGAGVITGRPTGRLGSAALSSTVASDLSSASDISTETEGPRPQPVAVSAAAAAGIDISGPGATIDPTSGRLVCNRRGVFAHPNHCGQFIVCAPQSRSQRALRPFEHHCPAEHIFHDSWGRCRPKSLQSDLGKFCQASGI